MVVAQRVGTVCSVAEGEMRNLRTIAALLHELATELERRSKLPLDEAIVSRLRSEDLSSNGLAYVLRRNRENVRRTCKLLEDAGRIRRVGQRWTLTE
jgi:hypothetical protein